MNNERASKKQQELLDFLDGFIKANGYGPSYREIMAGLGYKSVSTVATHLDGLIAKGYVARRDKSARSLEVIGRSPAVAPSSSAPVDVERELIRRLETVKPDSEQAATIRRAFELLGYTKAASYTEKDDAAVTS